MIRNPVTLARVQLVWVGWRLCRLNLYRIWPTGWKSPLMYGFIMGPLEFRWWVKRW